MTSQSSLNSHSHLQMLTEADAVGHFVARSFPLCHLFPLTKSASVERRTRCVFRLRSVLVKGTAETAPAAAAAAIHKCFLLLSARSIQGLTRRRLLRLRGHPAVDKTT